MWKKQRHIHHKLIKKTTAATINDTVINKPDKLILVLDHKSIKSTILYWKFVPSKMAAQLTYLAQSQWRVPVCCVSAPFHKQSLLSEYFPHPSSSEFRLANSIRPSALGLACSIYPIGGQPISAQKAGFVWMRVGNINVSSRRCSFAPFCQQSCGDWIFELCTGANQKGTGQLRNGKECAAREEWCLTTPIGLSLTNQMTNSTEIQKSTRFREE